MNYGIENGARRRGGGAPEPRAASPSAAFCGRIGGCGGPDDDGGVERDVIAPPPGEPFSETNDRLVAILLTYCTAYLLLAGDAEAWEEHS